MKVSSINDLSKKVFSGCSYRTNKLVPLSGSQTQTLSNTGTVNVQFEIPTQVVNLSKSRIAFDMLIPAQGASNSAWVHADPLSLFSRIQLLTRGGVSIMDITDCNKYGAIVQPITTPMTELIQRSCGGTSARSVVGTDNTTGLSVYNPIQGIQCSGLNAAANTTTSYRPSGPAGAVVASSQLPILEMRYLFNSTALNSAVSLSYQIALENLEHTILSINKNLYFGENLILSITFNPLNSFAWYSTSVTDPNSAGATALTGTTTVSNLSLYLKVEQNPAIIRGFQEKLMSPEGLTVICPYVYTSKVNTGPSSTTCALNFRLNRGYGQRLLRVYTTLFNNSETFALALDRCNEYNSGVTGPAKLNNYRTLLNSVQLQDYQIDCTRGEDWLVNSDIIEGSAVSSVDQYKYQFVHIDDFSGKQSILEEGNLVNDSDICGRDLSEEQLYTFVGNTVSAQYNLFAVVVVQRELVIRQGMIQWV